MNPDLIASLRLWLLTKASADRERADAIAPREAFLAKLLREDATQAASLAAQLDPHS